MKNYDKLIIPTDSAWDRNILWRKLHWRIRSFFIGCKNIIKWAPTLFEDRLDDVRRDPVRFLKDYGLDMNNFIDEDRAAQEYVDSDGYGIISSYDGNYDTIEIQGKDYYIFRTN